MRTVRILIEDDAAQAVRRGRPWVYREAVREQLAAPAGTPADVFDRRGGFVARGLADPEGAIAVRVLTREASEPFGPALVRRRLERALALRRRLLALDGEAAFRLCNGEGDRLPGLVVELYGAYAVVQLGTTAWAPHRELVCAALADLLPLRGIVEKSRLTPGRGGEVVQHLRGEEPPDEIVVGEGPARFGVQLRGTPKSGLFLDQRDTREALRRLARGTVALNAFSFTGALSVAAAQGGASRVLSLDLSAPALARARRNFALNGLDPAAHEWIQGDAFEEMPALERGGRRFGLVIIDPPAFATSKKRVFQAERDWRDLAALGLRLLEPGGVLVASSPVAAFPLASFERALADGAARAGAEVTVLEVRSQPADHPVDPACPERRYLKVLIAART